jgi:predicted ATPase
MRILKLKLSNFKRFSSLEIDLDQPITVLVGQNNSGKSTILEALRIAFEDNLRNEVYLNKKIGKTGTFECIVTCKLNEEEWFNAIKLVRQRAPVDIDVKNIIPLLAGVPIVITRGIQYVNGNVTNNYRQVALISEEVFSQIDTGAHTLIRDTVSGLRGQNIAVFAGVMYLSAERLLEAQESFVPFNSLTQQGERHRLVRNNLYFLRGL